MLVNFKKFAKLCSVQLFKLSENELSLALKHLLWLNW